MMLCGYNLRRVLQVKKDDRMSQPVDPKRRDFFSDLGRSLGWVIREFRREYYGTDEISQRLDKIEAELEQLEQNRQADLETAQRFERIERLLETIAKAADPKDQEQQARLKKARERLRLLTAALVGALGSAFLGAVVQEEIYPWLKQKWIEAGQVQAAELPPSPQPTSRPAATTPEPAPRRTSMPTPWLNLDMVTIPAGEFLMGSDKQKDSMAFDNETPQHQVYLPEYRIARVPVTNAQYKLYVDAMGHHIAPDYWQNGRIPNGKENHPVVNVSWNDAQAFCRWAGVRLPSEAEWEKAARGTDGLIWPWGDEAPDKNRCNFNDNVGNTTPVGKYSDGASPYGCLDMAGNVWEWTSSNYQNYPYNPNDDREDLEGHARRMLRGGSFGYNRSYVRCACRYWNSPDVRFDLNGFRVVSSPGF
jgi:formylglycine-generating enzyme required for sulfatase activity